MNTSIAVAEQQKHDITPGFGSLQSFELMQRAAKLLAGSTLVPAQYRAVTVKTDKFGNVTSTSENPNAVANCVIALNMAQRMGADPLMVMQNLYLVEGRPSWSAQWIIAAINGCGRFSPLRFDLRSLGRKTVEYLSSSWESGRREIKAVKVDIEDKVCVAWVIEKGTEARLESPAVSIEMAVREGWYTKHGSKWQTMDEVMLRYRSAAFFGKLYAPELLMGLQSVEEVRDTYTAIPDEDGVFSTTVVTLDGTVVADVPSTKPTKSPRRKERDVTPPPPPEAHDKRDISNLYAHDDAQQPPPPEQTPKPGASEPPPPPPPPHGTPPSGGSPADLLSGSSASAPVPEAALAKLASEGYIGMAKQMAADATITEGEIFKRFGGMTSWEGCTVGRVNEILAFIKNPIG